MNQTLLSATSLPIIQNDVWLAPFATAIADRLYRYRGMMLYIEEMAGSLEEFASLHKTLGLHYDAEKKGWWYREWAPNAGGLYLVGDFNFWDRKANPLTQRADRVWEVFVPDVAEGGIAHGSAYKVYVETAQGGLDRIPAFATYLIQDEKTKDFAPTVWAPAKPYQWKNGAPGPRPNPLIYEAHAGMATSEERVGSWTEFARDILPKVKALGYDTIQLMAVQEHPYYGSYGYHVSSLFAPSSRFGTPDELKALIDEAHGMGLAVIMDIVHSHAVRNIQEGLDMFDGSADQYFHPGARGEHPAWDSKLYQYGKWEVMQFLLSNVRYWLEEFRFDGYRFDGITSMLYTHHGLGKDFLGYADYFTLDTDPDAVLYLQLANVLAHTVNPDCLTVAEDMSGMPGLGYPVQGGGIGFDARLAMGVPDFWIKLVKEKSDEAWDIEAIYWQLLNRRTDEKSIAYVESHDQALVGDQTLMFRLMGPNIYSDMSVFTQSLVADRAVALHKLIRMMTASLGGEGYLTFMGNEFGHPEWIDFPREGNEWSYRYARRQWPLAEDSNLRYQLLLAWDKAMIALLKEHNVLQAAKPTFIKYDRAAQTLVFAKAGLVWVYNFSPTAAISDYQLWVPEAGKYISILSSDEDAFGGFGRALPGTEHFTDAEQSIRIYNVNRTVQAFARVD